MGTYTIKGKRYQITAEEEQKILSERTKITMFADRLECIDNMTDEETGQFFKAIMQHFRTGVMPVLNDRYMDAQLATIKNGADILNKQYITQTLKNRINSGSLLSPAEIKEPLEATGYPLEATGYDRKRMEATLYIDTGTVTDKVTDTGIDINKDKGEGKEIPTEEDIKRFFSLKWPDKDPDEFISLHVLSNLPENWRWYINEYFNKGDSS